MRSYEVVQTTRCKFILKCSTDCAIKSTIVPTHQLNFMNEGKVAFLLHFLAPWSFCYKNTSKTCKIPPKKPKTQLQVLIFNILPQKAKVLLFPAPPYLSPRSFPLEFTMLGLFSMHVVKKCTLIIIGHNWLGTGNVWWYQVIT